MDKIILIDKFNFLSMGSECSAAAAIKGLGLRIASYPFDWIRSNNAIPIIRCLSDDFAKFHTDLLWNGPHLTDSYGFDFAHDYPLEDGVIVNNWQDTYDTVIEKYQRRITRFRLLMKDPKPLIIFYRGYTEHCPIFKQIFKEKYNKTNVIFIVAHYCPSNYDYIFTCEPEKNGLWNDAEIWKEALDKAVGYLSTE
jgi:hypothetical protein